jgi:hypothetical protein
METAQATLSNSDGTPPEQPKSKQKRPLLGFSEECSPNSTSDTAGNSDCRQVNWVCYTGRYPHVFDAARLGFAIGHREDRPYQWSPAEVSLPVHFLDNNYKNADLHRFVQEVKQRKPEIAVLGDITDANDLGKHLEVGDELLDSHSDLTLIIVPKTEEILHSIPDRYVLGFPNGTSDIQGLDVAPYHEWQKTGNDIHILGGTPLQIKTIIDELTIPRLGVEPANIVGLDTNRITWRAMERGDYEKPSGGCHENLREDYRSARELISYSLINTREFWISHGIWPEDRSLTSRHEFDQVLDGNNKSLRSNHSRPIRELILTPDPKSAPSNPLCRSDTTNDVALEPLAMDTFLDEWLDRSQNWEPEGVCTSSTSYTSPILTTAGQTCSGCGRHLSADFTWGEQDIDWYEPTVVYYQTADIDSSNPVTHYESVSQDAPDWLVEPLSKSGPIVREVYCSQRCRDSTEYYRGNDLSTGDSFQRQFKTIAEVSIHQEKATQ